MPSNSLRKREASPLWNCAFRIPASCQRFSAIDCTRFNNRAVQIDGRQADLHVQCHTKPSIVRKENGYSFCRRAIMQSVAKSPLLESIYKGLFLGLTTSDATIHSNIVAKLIILASKSPM